MKSPHSTPQGFGRIKLRSFKPSSGARGMSATFNWSPAIPLRLFQVSNLKQNIISKLRLAITSHSIRAPAKWGARWRVCCFFTDFVTDPESPLWGEGSAGSQTRSPRDCSEVFKDGLLDPKRTYSWRPCLAIRINTLPKSSLSRKPSGEGSQMSTLAKPLKRYSLCSFIWDASASWLIPFIMKLLLFSFHVVRGAYPRIRDKCFGS